MIKMKKLLATVLAVCVLLSSFMVMSQAKTRDVGNFEDLDYSIDDILCYYEEALFITSCAGNIEANCYFKSYDDYDIFDEYYYTEYLDGYNFEGYYYDEVRDAFSVQLLIDEYGFDIDYANCSYDYDADTYLYSFEGYDEDDVYLTICAITDQNGYFLEYWCYLEEDYETYYCEYTEVYFTYLDKGVYIDNYNLYVNYNTSDLTNIRPVPGTEYYVVASDSRKVDIYESYSILEVSGRRNGEVELDIYDADTDEYLDTVYVEVDYTFWNWIVYIFFFGWIWM